MTVRLTGLAAIGAETAPALVIRASEADDRSGAAFEPFLIRQSLDWGDGHERHAERTWVYEWRPAKTGDFRVEPIRFVHLDPNSRLQTRLVTAPRIQVEGRTLFRASAHEPGERSRLDRPEIGVSSPNVERSWPVRGTLGLILVGLGFGVGRSRWLLRIRLRRALRRTMTTAQALELWRSFEPRIRHRANTDLALGELRNELERKAFGR